MKMEEKDFEPAGLIPRSIIRTVERFQQQLRPETIALGIQEFRISRYQVRVSVRYFFILLLLPITINWGTKNFIIKPLVEYFWNTYGTSLFLNSYQAERAFQEMRDFESQLFFEMLLSNSDHLSQNILPPTPVNTNTQELFLLPPYLQLLEGNNNKPAPYRAAQVPGQSFKVEPKSQVVAVSSGQRLLFEKIRPMESSFATVALPRLCAFWSNDSFVIPVSLKPSALQESCYQNTVCKQTKHFAPTRACSMVVAPSVRASAAARQRSSWRKVVHQVCVPVLQQGVVAFDPSASAPVLPEHSKALVLWKTYNLEFDLDESFFFSRSAANQNHRFSKRLVHRNVLINGILLKPIKTPVISVKLDPVLLSSHLTAATGYSSYDEFSHKSKPPDFPYFLRYLKRSNSLENDGILPLDTANNNLCSLSSINEYFIRHLIEKNNSAIPQMDLCFTALFQKKTMLLAEIYNQQSITALSNMFGDCIMIVSIILLLRWNAPQFTILKSFLIESFYSFNDAIKCFYIILITDFLVGFHSPRGWEITMEMLLRHLGLPENEEFILLFVGTFPVFLDTAFKYWIFRYLNKISPSTVATYHSMIE